MTVFIQPKFENFRIEARKFLQRHLSPQEIVWKSSTDDQLCLLDATEERASPGPSVVAVTTGTLSSRNSTSPPPYRSMNVSYEFIEKASLASCVRDPKRWDLLYRLLFRLVNENSRLLQNAIDPDVSQLLLWEKSVRRDMHKMHAFVRFKKEVVEGVETYVAWHQPEHLILEKTADFFVRRFGDKRWSIFTPDLSVHWDLEKLTYTEGILQSQFSTEDGFDEVWKSYYRSIFNPARIKIKAMRAEFPEKYWASLPEAEIIQELIRSAPSRLQTMAANQNLRATPPEKANWEEIKKASHTCRVCPMADAATKTVFGEGPQSARIMIVGEQPGDHEDQEGRPFVGPSGVLLDQALKEAGLIRENIYLTNAVKHFKFENKDKIRLHKKASGEEMHACKPWLEAEINIVKPDIIVVLGRTAATAVLGRLVKITSERGQIIENSPLAPKVLISWHPSAILREQDPSEQNQRILQLVDDLALAAKTVKVLEV